LGVTTIPPLGPIRYDIGHLTDEDFERLCWLVVRSAYPTAEIIANPDGGVDALLPGASARAWQAKRYTGNIWWTKCKDSLDRAVAMWDLRHVTFCFARDLTHQQRQKFASELEGRHRGVQVDWWGVSELHARLSESDNGQAIARRFFGNPIGDQEALRRAVALGGRLEGLDDAHQHLEQVAGAFAFKDPYYTVATVTHESDQPAPDMPQGTVAFIQRVGEGVTSRIDVGIRHPELLEVLPPMVDLAFTDDAEGAASLANAVAAAEGGTVVTLTGGVEVTLRDVPTPLGALAPRVFRPPAVALGFVGLDVPPTQSRLWLEDGEEWAAPVEMTFAPCNPPNGWQLAYRGTSGALQLRIAVRHVGFDQQNLFTFGLASDVSMATRVVALRFLIAVQSGGRVLIADAAGKSSPIKGGGRGLRPLGEPDRGVLALLEDLVLIEEASGAPLPWLGGKAVMAEAEVVATLASGIRAGRLRVAPGELTLDLSEEQLRQLDREGLVVTEVTDWELDPPLFASRLRLRGRMVLDRPTVTARSVSLEDPGKIGVTLLVPEEREGHVIVLERAASPPDG